MRLESMMILACVVALGSTTAFTQSGVAAEESGVLLAQAQPAPQQPAQAPQAQAPPPQAPQTPQQRVAMLKQWLQASQAQLRAYEWIETTVMKKGGEEKSRKQNRCYYGVDGKLEKLPVAGASSDESGGGPPGITPVGRLLKKAGKRKKKQLTEYMQKAGALIQDYIPPDGDRIQQSMNAGKMAVNLVEPGRRVRLDFKDYLKPGDVLSVELELPTNRLLGLSVSSYIDEPKDAVSLRVEMDVLPDGTIYTARTNLSAPAKDVDVSVENSGYHRTGG